MLVGGPGRSERERVVSISARRDGDYDTKRGKLEIINWD